MVRGCVEETEWIDVKVLFATAEYSPLVRVGGMAEATSGLVRSLRIAGLDVEVVVPDYFDTPLTDAVNMTLDVPGWAGPAVVRSGHLSETGPISLIQVPGMARPNPYVDADGQGWPDNADRFFSFSAAVAALAAVRRPDVLHCNDWHTAPTLGLLHEPVPTVLTIHTLGYQGWTSGGWLERITRRPDLFEAYGGTNPIAGAIQLADRVIAVSPSYADEIRQPETGSGLHDQLSQIGDRLIGIRNGIDTSVWDPATDTFIAQPFSYSDLAGKDACRADLLAEVGWHHSGAPTVGIIGRLVEQKGIELALDAVKYAETMPFRLVILGSGDRGIADYASRLAEERPDLVSFREAYDVAYGHKIFAGADLLMMPSRFEPCGLAQMQAMAYGTIPVVTAVGGLKDTVIDADADRKGGNGFMSASVDAPGVLDALHRAVRAWKHPARRKAIQRRGMVTDWSWETPAADHRAIYEQLRDTP